MVIERAAHKLNKSYRLRQYALRAILSMLFLYSKNIFVSYRFPSIYTIIYSSFIFMLSIFFRLSTNDLSIYLYFPLHLPHLFTSPGNVRIIFVYNRVLHIPVFLIHDLGPHFTFLFPPFYKPNHVFSIVPLCNSP